MLIMDLLLKGFIKKRKRQNGASELFARALLLFLKGRE
jgi:hypothetical protein